MSTKAVPRKARLRPPTLQVSSDVASAELKQSVQVFQVIPNIFISGYEAATNFDILSSAGITHILNLAGESKCPNVFPGSFSYFALKMPDNPKIDILFFLYFALDFILESIRSQGKVLIHCVKGTSRAAAVVLAYLMASGYSENEAYACLLTSHPTIDPNFGFVCQLKEWGRIGGEKRVYAYSQRYAMFVNAEVESECHIKVWDNNCAVFVTRENKEQEEFALACARVWERFNQRRAEIVYI